MKKNGMIKEKRTMKRMITPVVLFVLYVMMQLQFVQETWFEQDELDIYTIGKNISHGELLYKDVFSQHMPMTYYISAFFDKIGASTVPLQRLAFYCLFAFFWVVLFCRFKKSFNKYVLAIYPFVFCCLTANYSMGTAILSEHLAGVGAMFLLLEFLEFTKTKKITIGDSILLSIAIVLTFGTLFIAIYPVFIIFVGVMLIEIKEKKNKKLSFLPWVGYLLKKYILFLVIVAIPWVLLLLYYYMTGTLEKFVYGAYLFNRRVYPLYNGGFGGNIASNSLSMIDINSGVIRGLFDFSSWNYATIQQIIIVFGGILGMILLYKKYGRRDTIIVLVFLLSLGIRAGFAFHGTQFVEVLSYLALMAFLELVVVSKSHFQSLTVLKKGAVISLALVIAVGYTSGFSKVADFNFDTESDINAAAVEKLTDVDEPVWMLAFANSIVLRANRRSIGAEVNTPWTWNGFGIGHFKKLKKMKLRVAIYNPGLEVWDYKIKEYAPTATEYMEKNYKLVPGTTTVYVLNDYYEEACKIMNQNPE